MANYVKIKIRRDTTANWTANNPVLELGEIGTDLNLHRIKIGDGVRKWSELNWFDADIINNLNSDRTDAALSAAQGKILKNEILSIVESGGVPVVDDLTSYSTTSALSANQGRLLKEEIQAIITNSGVTIVDNLTSTSTTSALSANQGRELKSQLDKLSENSSSVEIIDSLTSSSSESALSANQGRILKSELNDKADKSDIEDVAKKIDGFGVFGMGYTVDSFNGYGKPTKITFEDGVSANLYWAGTKLDSIIASTGERITISYNSDGLITGRTVTRS